MISKKQLLVLVHLFFVSHVYAQDTLTAERLSLHAQTTVIYQYKPSFNVPYTGPNSLQPQTERKTSVTSTLFLGARLWHGASLFVNPELAGGSGLSEVVGIAAATNGETFRIGDPAPNIYLARLFFRQRFALSKNTVYLPSDFNRIGERVPERYVGVTVGKIGAADYFDNNRYSHDPRTQFMSWALMSNGAWDYPANTRGYTPSFVLEYVTPRHELRYGFSLVPVTANGNKMNWTLAKAGSHVLEYTHRYNLKNHSGAVRLLGFLTTTNMGNYEQSLAANPTKPDVVSTRNYGRTKWGFGLNAEQELRSDLGAFFKASWNDGHNETWMFTEIDRSLSAGLSLDGTRWKRAGDNIGLAYVASGISKPHRNYLRAGGNGFILGDGRLNYALEQLAELYYSAAFVEGRLYVSGVYQFLRNPGYNKDRNGPVSIFSIRVHTQL